MNLYDFVGGNFRQPLLDLLAASTRALNAYADSRDRVPVSVVVNRDFGVGVDSDVVSSHVGAVNSRLNGGHKGSD